MTKALDGTVALVTGASSGIGEATASLLAAHGTAVVIAARRKDRLDRLVERIESAGGRALAIAADVTEREQASGVVEHAGRRARRRGDRADPDHLRSGVREQIRGSFTFERLKSGDVADAIAYIVTRARHVAINELLIRPIEQVRLRCSCTR